MKKILTTLTILSIIGFFNTTANAERVAGFLYKNASEAGVGYSAVNATKIGTSKCKGYFGLVGIGDCSVRQAAKNGNIKTVAYYDTYTKNIFGFKVVITRAYGN